MDQRIQDLLNRSEQLLEASYQVQNASTALQLRLTRVFERSEALLNAIENHDYEQFHRRFSQTYHLTTPAQLKRVRYESGQHSTNVLLHTD